MSNVENDGDAIIEMDILPPRWLDLQDDVSQHLADITVKMKRLDNMHAKHVLPGFDDESVKAREEREIENLTQDITRDFTSCQKAIRRIDQMIRDQGSTVSQADATMAQNLKISLATRIGDVSTLFRKKQSAYLKKLRSLGGIGGSSSPFDGRSGTPSLAQNPYTDPAMMDSETDRSSAQSTLLQTAQVRRRTGVMDSAIEQREREIEKIAQGVIDLSNLFQELQTMVIDQGTVLDRIDYNVERTAEHVKEAHKELKVATGYQKRGVKRKAILLLILVIVGMFILLLVKPKGRGAPAVPPLAPSVPSDPGVRLARDDSSLDVSKGVHAEWKQRRRRKHQDDDFVSA